MYSLLSWTIQACKALLYVNTCLYLHVSEKNYKDLQRDSRNLNTHCMYLNETQC